MSISCYCMIGKIHSYFECPYRITTEEYAKLSIIEKIKMLLFSKKYIGD